jgi:3' terminal RNA ribose 2'-O-methyltransferase Hen1
VLLTITTTHRPATDLGYLLHKHPQNLHSRRQSYGVAHVFYPEVSDERCTAVLFVEVDPVGLVRDRKGFSSAGLMDQYVNDRPYAASSLLSAAMVDSFGSAMNGRSGDRPELATQAIPLEFTLPSLPCRRGGEALLRSLFEPLGYTVEAASLGLDDRFGTWGMSNYFSVSLATTSTLQAALSHLYVLIPVLDNAKHYWVGEDEVDKLLARGEPWLSSHPQRELIVRRYLKYRRSLADLATDRLLEANGDPVDVMAPEGDEVVRGDEQERRLEQGLSLNDQRMARVTGVIESLAATSLIDLGCGEGRLLKQVLPIKSLTRVTGMDVSHRSLEIARDRLKVDRLPQILQDKLTLLHGSLVYRDARFEGYDVATIVEVIEHLDESRLEMFTRVVFEFAKPKAVVVTTPNVEYNVKFPALPAGCYRHADHRFEWTRAQFEVWARSRAERFGYTVQFEPIGGSDPLVGPPTQMGIFHRQG